jgi:hypothetical protein
LDNNLEKILLSFFHLFDSFLAEKRTGPSIMVECSKEPQENGTEKEMERLKTSLRWRLFLIILSIGVTIFLIVWYSAILQMKTTAQVAHLWIHGLVVALGLGHLWTFTFLTVMRNRIYHKTLKRKEIIKDVYIGALCVPAWVVGTIERTFFGALVAFDISATAAAMVTWILVKMATDWHRILPPIEEKGKHIIGPRSLAFGSLLAGMISLLFALIGGLVCRMAIDP